MSCLQWFKDTNLKANHNWQDLRLTITIVVSNGSKILIWKQITTRILVFFRSIVVSNGSKILIWKQITTHIFLHHTAFGCLQWFKDTNLKANHNITALIACSKVVVSNGSKILIWKQITTSFLMQYFSHGCLQWFKDTNLKANHNGGHVLPSSPPVVSNGSKILIWKQITTVEGFVHEEGELSPMVQRY